MIFNLSDCIFGVICYYEGIGGCIIPEVPVPGGEMILRCAESYDSTVSLELYPPISVLPDPHTPSLSPSLLRGIDDFFPGALGVFWIKLRMVEVTVVVVSRFFWALAGP